MTKEEWDLLGSEAKRLTASFSSGTLSRPDWMHLMDLFQQVSRRAAMAEALLEQAQVPQPTKANANVVAEPSKLEKFQFALSKMGFKKHQIEQGFAAVKDNFEKAELGALIAGALAVLG